MEAYEQELRKYQEEYQKVAEEWQTYEKEKEVYERDLLPAYTKAFEVFEKDLLPAYMKAFDAYEKENRIYDDRLNEYREEYIEKKSARLKDERDKLNDEINNGKGESHDKEESTERRLFQQ